MPKISIIIPVYNAEQYLEECLLSISQQTFTDFEIWAINDGSKDRSLEILKKYQEKEPRLKVFSQENKGVSAARNLGLENASGDFITFVDADDTIKNDYLSQLISVFLLDKSVDLAVCGFLGSETRVFKEISFIINEENIENVISLFDKYLLFPPYCKLYKHAIIAENGIKFNETINFSEDILFNLDYLAYCNKIHSYNYVGYNYRIVENSLSKREDLSRFVILENTHDRIDNYFGTFANSQVNYINYMLELDYWNAYNSLHALLKNKSMLSDKEIFQWLKTTLNFRFYNQKRKDIIEKTFFMRLSEFKSPFLLYLYLKLR